MAKDFQKTIDQLLEKIDRLEAVVAAQQKTIESQQKTIKKLETQLAAAKKNSSNSSKPPSSDIVAPKKKNQSGDANNDTTKRKIGAQPGHPPNFRPDFPLEQVDAVFEYKLDECPICGSKLQDADRAPTVVQQIKIVEKPVKIEEHRGIPHWCPTCQCYHYAPLPPHVEYGGLFDAKLSAMVAYLKTVCHASFSTIRKFLRDIIGIKVSRGYLKKVLEKISDALELPYDSLCNALPNQKTLHIDESSLPENGKNLWIWAFEAKLFVLYKIDPSRGSKVLVEMLGKEFQGVIGCDYFSAYRKYMKDFNVVVQFCLAHLIRDIKYLTTLSDKASVAYGERLREQMRSLFELIHSRDAFSPGEFTKKLLSKRDEILASVMTNVPESREAKNLAKRFEKHGEYFFTFVTTPEIEPTNNIAERAIRFITIDRLITQGVRGEWGRQFLERMWSVVSTCERQGRDILKYLEESLCSLWNNESPPPLIYEE